MFLCEFDVKVTPFGKFNFSLLLLINKLTLKNLVSFSDFRWPPAAQMRSAALVRVFNYSQTKFVAIILVLSVFFNAIFRLTDFSSDAFDFSSSKTG